MAYQISPFANDQFFDANGLLASGYKLFTYLAGTSQKEPVFVDVNGVTNHTNPIILNSIGMPPSPIFLPVAKKIKFVYASPTDTDPPASPLYTCESVDVGFDQGGSPASEWVLGTTPTYVSATSFSVTGDQRATYHVGRRVMLTSSIGTRYGTISASAFGAATTVTVILDSGALDINLATVFYGFLSAAGSSWPAGYNTGLNTTLNGNLVVPPGSNFNLLPIGMFAPFAGSILPAGYLWCDGSAQSRATYAALFGAIGGTYGNGDGSTTFNVPDLRGRFPLGKDDMGGTAAGRVTVASKDGGNAVNLGGVGGLQNHVILTAEMASHKHNLTYGTIAGSGFPGLIYQDNGGSAVISAPIANTGNGDAHNNMPPWIACNYIIRYA